MSQNQALLHEQQDYIVAVFCYTLKYVLGKDQILSLYSYKHFLQIAYNLENCDLPHKEYIQKQSFEARYFSNLKWNKM